MAAHTDCRMYESKFPEVDDVVMVQVKSIAEMGAYVALLEYNGIEGMILLSELSRRRIRSITKLIKVGRQEPVMVLRVDKEKGYIDLSKRRVAAEDISACEEKYNKSKMVHSIIRHVAETTGTEVEELYEAIGWPLYKAYGHAFEAFKFMVQDPESIFQKLVSEHHGGQQPAVLTPEVKEAVVKNVRRRMTPQPLKIRADVELTCYAYDGVLFIKAWVRSEAELKQCMKQEAMRAGESASTEACTVKVKLVAPPLYVLTTQTLDRNLGIEVVNAACEACKAAIEERKGRLVVKASARAVSERDDRLLTDQMKVLEEKNREVAGDDESDDDFEEGMGDIDVESKPAMELE